MTAEELVALSIPMNDAVSHLPAWGVPSIWSSKLKRGQTPPWKVLKIEKTPKTGDQGRLVSKSGDLLALGKAELSPGPIGRSWQEALDLKLVRVI